MYLPNSTARFIQFEFLLILRFLFLLNILLGALLRIYGVHNRFENQFQVYNYDSLYEDFTNQFTSTNMFVSNTNYILLEKDPVLFLDITI